MKIQIVTLFPAICEGVLGESILKRARAAGLVEIEAVDLRRWTTDRHRTADDAPYGGGPGMVMKIEPVHRALRELRGPESKVVLMTPQGRLFNQSVAREYAAEKHLILLCGHYEGIDQRVADHLVDDELSIGDYVLTNGALAALVVTDAIVRLIPGVLGDAESAAQDSFSENLLDHPHYTRPEVYEGWAVPEVLLSGNHAAVAKWRRNEAKRLTQERRPDLIRGDDHAPSESKNPTAEDTGSRG
jgi:tRNA (guanine37-N1)-methyltransferase